MVKTPKWTHSHDWIETSTIKEYHPWQNKWYPDIYVLTPDDEGTPGGDVVLFLRVTAKSLMRYDFNATGINADEITLPIFVYCVECPHTLQLEDAGSVVLQTNFCCRSDATVPTFW